MSMPDDDWPESPRVALDRERAEMARERARQVNDFDIPVLDHYEDHQWVRRIRQHLSRASGAVLIAIAVGLASNLFLVLWWAFTQYVGRGPS